MSWRLIGVASFESGPIGVHANGGVVRGGIADEIVLAGALAVALHPRATFTTELLRRHVSGMGAFELTDLIGHDVNYAVTFSVVVVYFQDKRLQPAHDTKVIADGWALGRKEGAMPSRVQSGY